MNGTVTVDIAGAQMGGAARYAAELRGYLARTGRQDVQVIGAGGTSAQPGCCGGRSAGRRARRVAVNNVSFVSPGGERWALLRNALHFLTDDEAAGLDPALRNSVRRQAAVVRLAARRADVLVVPCTAMAERVTRVLPAAREPDRGTPAPGLGRIGPGRRPGGGHPVPGALRALTSRWTNGSRSCSTPSTHYGDPAVRVRVTASPADLPPALAANPRIEFLGRLDQHDLRQAWARSRAIYFPTGLESFGYPLAEARASGQPVIARDTRAEPGDRRARAVRLRSRRSGIAAPGGQVRPDDRGGAGSAAVRPGCLFRLAAGEHPMTRLGLRPYRVGDDPPPGASRSAWWCSPAMRK